MFKTIFLKAGLSPTQAAILEHLFAVKEDKAGAIAKIIKKSRAIVYKDLEELVSLKIVEKIDRPNRVGIFRIDHPSNLEKFYEDRENELKKDRQLFNNYLPDLVAGYNTIHNKPGLKFYEGWEGIAKALENLAAKLKQNTEIISFTKVLTSASSEELPKALANFITKRVQKNVKTRVIAIDTPEGRKLKEADEKNLRQTRLVATNQLPPDFPGGEIYLYDDEIYLMAHENNQYFAFTIENKSITQLLKAFFEIQWNFLKSPA